MALPVARIRIEQGHLQIYQGDTIYIVQQIAADVHQQEPQEVWIEADAMLGARAAIVHVAGRVSLDFSQPSGAWRLTASSPSLPELAQTLPGLLPAAWTLAQGSLQAEAQIELRNQMLQGTLKGTLAQVHGQVQHVTMRDVSLASEMRIEGNLAQGTLTLQGPLHLQAEQLSGPADLTATGLTLDTPVRLTYAPEQWQAQVELKLQSQILTAEGTTLQQWSSTAPLQAQSTGDGWSLHGTVGIEAPNISVGAIRQQAKGVQLTTFSGEAPVHLTYTPKQWQAQIDLSMQSHALQAGDAIRVERLSSTLPLRLQSAARSWRVHGTAAIAAQTVHVNIGGRTKAGLRLDGLQGKLPVQATTTSVDLLKAHLRAKAWRWRTAGTTQAHKSLKVNVSSRLDMQHQRLRVRPCTVAMPGLGEVSIRGTWAWSTQTAHDMQVELKPESAAALWHHAAILLPAPYQAWQVEGRTRLELQAARFAWRARQQPQSLRVHWRLDDMAFSSPEGEYAGEHINGALQATVALTPGKNRYAVQSTLTLKPFALLLGSFFPALEQNRISPVMTLNGTYHIQADRLELDLTGQFGKLGTLILQGEVRQLTGPQHYEMVCTLRRINAKTVWQTFLAGPEPNAEAPTRIQGRLDARLQLRGQATSARAQGHVDINGFHLQSGALTLEDVTLRLPVDIRYPLPQTAPKVAELPDAAYGRLRIAQARLGSMHIPRFTTRLVLQSDSVVFRDDITLALLQGRLSLQQMVVHHLLQPQRQIRFRLRLHNLDLRALQRDTSALPLAGTMDADFPRVQLQGDQLHTQGALTLHLAGGRIRIFDVQGRDLFSLIPTLQGPLKTEEPISLFQLTRIYPIGDIGGTLHFSIDGLTITAGEPAAFHLIFRVQEKRGEKREITLRALNNLLFTIGSATVETDRAHRFPYRQFGADVTLRHDILRLRGLYHDKKGREYFMRPLAFGIGAKIVNNVPDNRILFRKFLQQLKSRLQSIEDPKIHVGK